MRRFRWLGLALVLRVPMPAGAQAVQPADLVGTWVHLQSEVTAEGKPATLQHVLTLRPDSTWLVQVRRDGMMTEYPVWVWWTVAGTNAGRWSLAHDSLWFGDPPSSDAHAVRLRDGKLLLDGPAQDPLPDECAADRMLVLESINPAKPLPVLTLPPPTMKSTDLVGTWVWSDKLNDGIQYDTLMLRADSAYVSVQGRIAGEDTTHVRLDQKWRLGSGDLLIGIPSDIARPPWTQKIALQGQQLLFSPCERQGKLISGTGRVYSRIAP